MPDPDDRWHAEQVRALAQLSLNATRDALPKLEALVLAAEAHAGAPNDPAALRRTFGEADTALSGAVLALGSLHDHLKQMPERAGDVGAPPALSSTTAEA